jgi:hypothetical protein
MNLAQQEILQAQFNVSPFKKNSKKPINGMIRLFGFIAKKLNLTEPNQFGLNLNSVRFEFSKI